MAMQPDEIIAQLTEGTVLEGPHWTEPIKVLTAKARGSRVEIQAVGTHTKKLWTKLLRAEDFDGSVKVTLAGALAGLTGERNTPVEHWKAFGFVHGIDPLASLPPPVVDGQETQT